MLWKSRDHYSTHTGSVRQLYPEGFHGVACNLSPADLRFHEGDLFILKGYFPPHAAIWSHRVPGSLSFGGLTVCDSLSRLYDQAENICSSGAPWRIVGEKQVSFFWWTELEFILTGYGFWFILNKNFDFCQPVDILAQEDAV